MLREIYLLQFKSFLRSPSFEGDLIKRVLLGLGVLNLLLFFGVFAWFLPEILRSLDPQNPSLELTLGRFFIFYLLLDLLLRYFYQPLPGFNYPHFALLPVEKRKLLTALLLGSVFNLFNFAGLLLISPFFVSYLIPAIGLLNAMLWFSGMLIVFLFSHFLSVWIKIRIQSTGAIAFVLIVLLLLIGGFAYVDILSLMDWSALFFGANLINGFSHLVFLPPVVLLFFLSKRALLDSLYNDRDSGSAVKKQSRLIRISGDSNLTIRLFVQEVLLIFRNKRPLRLFLSSAALAVVYFYFIYLMSENPFSSPFLMLFFAMFMLGFWLNSYGQFLTAWESIFYDGLMTLPIDPEDYLRAKWLILAVPVSVIYLLLLVLCFFFFKSYMVFLTALWLLLIGPASLLTLALSMFNKKRMLIDQSSWFDSQGKSGIQSLLLPLILMLLLLTILPFYAFEYQLPGMLFWIFSGIVILATHNFWIRKLAALFERRKHYKLENYRKKSA